MVRECIQVIFRLLPHKSQTDPCVSSSSQSLQFCVVGSIITLSIFVTKNSKRYKKTCQRLKKFYNKKHLKELTRYRQIRLILKRQNGGVLQRSKNKKQNIIIIQSSSSETPKGARPGMIDSPDEPLVEVVPERAGTLVTQTDRRRQTCSRKTKKKIKIERSSGLTDEREEDTGGGRRLQGTGRDRTDGNKWDFMALFNILPKPESF